MRKETKIIGCGWMSATMDAISADASLLSAKGKGRRVQITETCSHEHCNLRAQTTALKGETVKKRVLRGQNDRCNVYNSPSPYVKVKN